jgi:hypothetical protein
MHRPRGYLRLPYQKPHLSIVFSVEEMLPSLFVPQAAAAE